MWERVDRRPGGSTFLSLCRSPARNPNCTVHLPRPRGHRRRHPRRSCADVGTQERARLFRGEGACEKVAGTSRIGHQDSRMFHEYIEVHKNANGPSWTKFWLHKQDRDNHRKGRSVFSQ